MGNFELAAEELDQVLAGESPANRADALRMRGDVKLRQGKPTEAAIDFRGRAQGGARSVAAMNRIGTN